MGRYQRRKRALCKITFLRKNIVVEVIVQIGTEEQKLLIEKEIRFYLDNPSFSSIIRKVFVPDRFDEYIISIIGKDYISNRDSINQQVIAKTIPHIKGSEIVINSILYRFDESIRYMHYVHEAIHAKNYKDFQLLKKIEKTYGLYKINELYDEYLAVRISWVNTFQNFGSLKALMEFYQQYLLEIEKEIVHGSLDKELTQKKERVENYLLKIIYSSAMHKCFKEEAVEVLSKLNVSIPVIYLIEEYEKRLIQWPQWFIDCTLLKDCFPDFF